MARHCIGCGREIAKQQTQCHVCGATQNYFAFHIKTIIFCLALLSSAAYASYYYVEQASISIKEQAEQQHSAQTSQAQLRIETLEQELSEVKVTLEQTQTSLASLNESQASADQQSDSKLRILQKKLLDVEEALKKQEGRASWLAKENARLKSELDTLKQNNSPPTLEASTNNNSESSLSVEQASETDLTQNEPSENKTPI